MRHLGQSVDKTCRKSLHPGGNYVHAMLSLAKCKGCAQHDETMHIPLNRMSRFLVRAEYISTVKHHFLFFVIAKHYLCVWALAGACGIVPSDFENEYDIATVSAILQKAKLEEATSASSPFYNYTQKLTGSSLMLV